MPWELTGNLGINPTTNFLGTLGGPKDNAPLIIKTNGVERLRIDSLGNVSIQRAELSPKLQDATLTVAGLIHSTAGGIQFPDGSTQTTALLGGPQGPQGPRGLQVGPQGPRGPQGSQGPPGAPGSAHTSAVCGPFPCARACSHVVAAQQTPCIVTSNTGHCESTVANEWCCVCAP